MYPHTEPVLTKTRNLIDMRLSKYISPASRSLNIKLKDKALICSHGIKILTVLDYGFYFQFNFVTNYAISGHVSKCLNFKMTLSPVIKKITIYLGCFLTRSYHYDLFEHANSSAWEKKICLAHYISITLLLQTSAYIQTPIVKCIYKLP